jgi:hypothetical protein
MSLRHYKQGPVLIYEPCGCKVDHGIPTRCEKHSFALKEEEENEM